MKLHELKAAEGTRKNRNRVGRGLLQETAKQLEEVIKGKKHVLAEGCVQDLKAVKHHYSNVCQNVDLQILTVKNMRSLI